MFKKFFAIALSLAITMSICACGTVSTAESDANKAKEERVLEQNSDFVVTKLDWEEHATSNGTYSEYRAVVKNDKYAMMIRISIDEYILWEIGDAIDIVVTESYELGKYIHRSYIGEEYFYVEWFGELN